MDLCGTWTRVRVCATNAHEPLECDGEQMAKTTHISVRIRPDLGEKVEALAGTLDRSKSWVVEQALEEYLTTQEWQIAAIKEGVAAADRGELVPDDAVAEWIESWGGPNEKPRPRSRRS